MLQAAFAAKLTKFQKVDMEPASDKESQDEWDLNNPADCLDMLDKSFPAADCKKKGRFASSTSSISKPRAPSSHWRAGSRKTSMLDHCRPRLSMGERQW